MIGHEIHHDAAGIISSNFEENENHQPFLVAFFKYGANNSKLKPRRIRDVNKKKEKSDAEVSYNVNPLTCMYIFLCSIIVFSICNQQEIHFFSLYYS